MRPTAGEGGADVEVWREGAVNLALVVAVAATVAVLVGAGYVFNGLVRRRNRVDAIS